MLVAGCTSDATVKAIQVPAARPRTGLVRASFRRLQEQRDGDVQEHQQREQPIAQAAGFEEVARQRIAEHGQPVEPLGGGDSHVLGQHVPYQQIAADCRREQQPQQRHAADPRESPGAAKPPERELPQ